VVTHLHDIDDDDDDDDPIATENIPSDDELPHYHSHNMRP
jgi:hypothetical protein